MKSLGIDFGGTSVKLGLCDGDTIIGRLDPLPTPEFHGPGPLIDAMAGRVAEARLLHPDLAAVGVGVPGFVNFSTGFAHRLTNVRGWDEVPLRDLLSEKTGLPVTIDNDANCMAYAEFRLGAGRGSRHMVAMTLGTGVGGGVVINGRLHRGASFGAGEIGHMSVHYEGRTGPYNNRGCLEEYVGHRQVAQHAVELYRAAGISKTREECDPFLLAEAARSFDKVALRVWDEVARILACELSSICWLISPDTFVIGGGMAGAGEILFEPLLRHMKGQLHPLLFESVQVVPARFGNEAGLLGAAILAADEVST